MNTNYNNYNFPGGSTQAPLVVQLVKNPPAMQETWVGKKKGVKNKILHRPPKQTPDRKLPCVVKGGLTEE